MDLSIRKWATPLTIGTFLLMGVTGVLIFFHLDSGFNNTAHEWVGLVMVMAVGFHVFNNFPSFRKNLQSVWGKRIIGAFAALLALSFLSFGQGGEPPVRAMMGRLASAPLSAVAQVLETDPAVLVERAKAQGLAVDGAHQSLKDLAGGDMEKAVRLMGPVFGEGTAKPE